MPDDSGPGSGTPGAHPHPPATAGAWAVGALTVGAITLHRRDP